MLFRDFGCTSPSPGWEERSRGVPELYGFCYLCQDMKKLKYILAVGALLALSAAAEGQTRSFTLGKWVEIQNSILKELNRSYVDTLPLDRIERLGIDAMLEGLDPYTVYVPEEEQENFQMMISGVYGGIGAIIYKPDKDGNVIINEPYADSPAVR